MSSDWRPPNDFFLFLCLKFLFSTATCCAESFFSFFITKNLSQVKKRTPREGLIGNFSFVLVRLPSALRLLFFVIIKLLVVLSGFALWLEIKFNDSPAQHFDGDLCLFTAHALTYSISWITTSSTTTNHKKKICFALLLLSGESGQRQLMQNILKILID